MKTEVQRRERKKSECLHCGRTFAVHSGAKCCSKACGQRYRAKDCPGRKLGRQCKGCGNDFDAKRTGNKGLYCSRECAFKNDDHFRGSVRLREARAISSGCHRWLMKWKSCVKCGATHCSHGVNCSSECKRKRTCPCCGATYETGTGIKYCQSCSVSRAKDVVRAGKAKRRHRVRGNGRRETVHPMEVFKRDNWMCHLCGEPCDRDAQFPEHKAPTMDHVIPISKGGSHSMDNIKTACFICNSRKSDIVSESVACT